MSVRQALARTEQAAEQPPTRRPSLRVVPWLGRRRSRVPFVVLMLLVLGIGLVGLLLVNTSLQQGAFVIHDLETKAGQLEERQSVLEQRVADRRSPVELSRRAEKLGMEPNTEPVFLRVSDGKVAGDSG